MSEIKTIEQRSEIGNYERRTKEHKTASWERFSDLLIKNIDRQIAETILNIIRQDWDNFMSCPGSKNKHQPWEGGFIDHYEQLLRYAFRNYNSEEIMQLPEHERYTKTDLAIVAFLHDIEKIGKYTGSKIEIVYEYSGFYISEYAAEKDLGKDWKEKRKTVKMEDGGIYVFSDKEYFAQERGLFLEIKHRIALHYVHGENYGTYNKKYRRQNPLGAAVGNADRYSARVLFNQGFDSDGNIKKYLGPNLEGENVGTISDILLFIYNETEVN